MRLLQIKDTGNFSLVERIGNDIPPYAILSHTWGADEDEVTFRDLIEGTGKSKIGYCKLDFCAKQTARDSLEFFWVDTCCIDKSSSAELSEAINSMFRWYRGAAKCYVCLSDVSTTGFARNDMAFQKSRWFTRGWTLQELLAPTSIEFFSTEGDLLGDRDSLLGELVEITGIPTKALQGSPLTHFGIEERMLWAEGRETKREEDAVYSLLGIFDVHMPLIYGEGRAKALKRLQRELNEASENSATVIPQSAQHHSAIRVTNPTYYIPFPKNRYFVGRRNELDVLEQRLIADRDCHKMSIVGLSGIGKTQVALQFAYVVKKTWPEFSVFWVSVLSMKSFNLACIGIARALHLPLAEDDENTARVLVKQRLSAGSIGPWLLVLDDANDPDILFGTGQSKGIMDYLPESEEGVIVCTTRTVEVALSITRSDTIELGAMHRQDAASFLEKSLMRKDLIRDGAAMTELLDKLNCLPLAIAHAAAYLNMNDISIARYLRLLPDTEQDIGGLMGIKPREDVRHRVEAAPRSPAIAGTETSSFELTASPKEVPRNTASYARHKLSKSLVPTYNEPSQDIGLPKQNSRRKFESEVRRKLVVVGDGMVGKTCLL
jgi:hypothetical protein